MYFYHEQLEDASDSLASGNNVLFPLGMENCKTPKTDRTVCSFSLIWRTVSALHWIIGRYSTGSRLLLPFLTVASCSSEADVFDPFCHWIFVFPLAPVDVSCGLWFSKIFPGDHSRDCHYPRSRGRISYSACSWYNYLEYLLSALFNSAAFCSF